MNNYLSKIRFCTKHGVTLMQWQANPSCNLYWLNNLAFIGGGEACEIKDMKKANSEESVWEVRPNTV